MKAKKMLAAAALGLGATMASSQALAQGFYIGASLGKTDADDGIAVPVLITSGTVDGKDSGMKLFGGYAFSKNFALEMSYVDLGKLTYSGTFGGTPVTGGSVETTGFNFSAVGTFPLNPSFSLFGKIGLLMWEAEAKDTTGGLPFSATDDGGDLSFGFGASYSFNKNFSVQAEWEQFDAVDSISMLSVGAVYRF